MQDERRDVVRDHSYDGIQEFDNKLPNWWVGTFVLSLLFGLYWFTTRHTFAEPANDSYAHYRAAMQELRALQASKAGAGPTDEEVLAAMADAARLADGRSVFQSNCAACHAADGGGGIGPNLTDSYWIHGGKPSQIAHTITVGVPEKGMVTWKGVLSPEQIRNVAAYVVSLRGTKPAQPKAPQGVKED
jgi:cytochrome c oxidase cbb3-type subunit 3